jgi:hypothetical protein
MVSPPGWRRGSKHPPREFAKDGVIVHEQDRTGHADDHPSGRQALG